MKILQPGPKTTAEIPIPLIQFLMSLIQSSTSSIHLSISSTLIERGMAKHVTLPLDGQVRLGAADLRLLLSLSVGC